MNINVEMRRVSNEMRLDPRYNLDHIERVISIVSPSRAGSSVFKWCIASHPAVCALAGEEEPYYKLACNGYPWDESDWFYMVNNPEFIRLAMANELANHESAFNRQLLQTNEIEEPPYVESIQCKTKNTLVLKTPQNIYRRGVMEQLFPGRRIDYIFLSRGFAQTVNGLIDGWYSDDFKARLVNGNWWKFDMPPGWTTAVPIPMRCYHQWKQASLHGLGDYPDAIRVKFEDFMLDGPGTCSRVFGELGLAPYTVDKPPVLMSTKPPAPYRWKDKASTVMQFCDMSAPIMQALGYTMDIQDWI